MRVKTKKATFSLRVEVLEALDKAVAEGVAGSKNALVEQPLEKELQVVRRQTRLAHWQAGAADKLLLQDIREVERDFESASAETLPGDRV